MMKYDLGEYETKDADRLRETAEGKKTKLY